MKHKARAYWGHHFKIREARVSPSHCDLFIVPDPEASNRYKLVAMKLVTPSKEHLEKHYEDLSDKPFYKGLVTCEQPPLEIHKNLIKY